MAVTPLDVFYTDAPSWHEKIGDIHALLERVKISEERSGDLLRLRKLSRILSIHASTAIEGNRLTLSQVTDVINGKPVLGPPKDIKEVQNASLAYDYLDDYDPWSTDDLLKAHPLIKSSAVHYMLEHIHPFRDGNGRIGRLWQTLILTKWNPLFAWMPVETLVHHNQALYYKALQDSNVGSLDCRPFISFMLDAIANSLYKYIDVATETTEDVGVNVGVNEQVLDFLRRQPDLSARELATLLNKSKRTVERYLQELREQDRIRRVGSDKAGHWEIIEGSS